MSSATRQAATRGSASLSEVAGLLLTAVDSGSAPVGGRDRPPPARQALAEHAGALLSRVAAPVLEVGPGLSGLLAVHDERAVTPLEAVIAGWQRLRKLGSTLPTVVVACDPKLLSSELLALVARWPAEGSVVPVLDGQPQWCAARYSPDCLELAGELLASGQSELSALGDTAGSVTWLGPAELGEAARASTRSAPACDLLDDGPAPGGATAGVTWAGAALFAT